MKVWNAEPVDLVDSLRIGTSVLSYDAATGEQIQQRMIAEMPSLFDLTENELLINNAYLIPGQWDIQLVQRLTDRGVRVRILTNPLASHDVPAVSRHYQEWRDDLIKAWAELYELRADAAIRSSVEVPPAQVESIGLHTKSDMVDRRQAFVGSMNLDPRSAIINTEAERWSKVRH